jgi:ornithine carbamoyltransferase
MTPNEILKSATPDLLRDLDLTNDELLYLLDLAAEVKQCPRDYAHVLDGKSIALLFEKPSLRTKLTFDLAIKQLGGDSTFLEGPIGVREPLKDIARNLDRWFNGLVARVFAQQTVEDLAQWSSVPVINALSDMYHPCQALADVMTVRERFGRLAGLKLAFIGDGNNVAQSLMLTCLRLGMNYALACPVGYNPNPDILDQAEGLAAVSGASLMVTHNPAEALEGAHAVYTDVWASMGQEDEKQERDRTFRPYQVNGELFRLAKPDAIFMHCLPAHRGDEVTPEVIDSVHSVVFQQAENRLHAQKAIMLELMKHEVAVGLRSRVASSR